MDSPPTSDAVLLDAGTRDQASLLRFLSTMGTAYSAAPREWESAWLEVILPIEQWGQTRLLRQGQPLELLLKHVDGQPRMGAEWPRSGPGHYEITVERGGMVLERCVVTVLPAKISQLSLVQMLDDLQSRLPAAVAIGLQRLGGLTGIQLLPPEQTSIAAELVRLRRAVLGSGTRPGLATILEGLAADPYQVLAPVNHWVDRQHVRRPLPAALAQAISLPQNLGPDKLPERVLDARVQHTADVYENRLINLYAKQLELHLLRLVHIFRVGLMADSADIVQSLLSKLLSARSKARFLESVATPAYLPIQVSMVLINRPLYRAAFEGYLEFHRAVAVRLESPALDAPLENLPYLYQLWGLLEVVKTLQRVAVELGYRIKSHQLIMRDASSFFLRIIRDGRPVLILVHPETECEVRVIPERTYPMSSIQRLHSVSYAQRPDIAIEVEKPGKATRIYLFDPKYKLDGETNATGESSVSDISNGKPKKIDIDKMHTYRDAIRDELDRYPVQYASILYPGPDVRYEAPGVEALHAYPGEAERLEQNLADILSVALQSL